MNIIQYYKPYYYSLDWWKKYLGRLISAEMTHENFIGGKGILEGISVSLHGPNDVGLLCISSEEAYHLVDPAKFDGWIRFRPAEINILKIYSVGESMIHKLDREDIRRNYNTNPFKNEGQVPIKWFTVEGYVQNNKLITPSV